VENAPERSQAPRAAELAILPSLGTHSCAWAEHPFPAERSRRGVFVHCVQWYELSHRGEIYLMLGLMGMEAPDV
jgi:hypothetical protein